MGVAWNNAVEHIWIKQRGQSCGWNVVCFFELITAVGVRNKRMSGVRPQLMLMKLELLCCVNHGLQGNSRWHHSGVRPQLMLELLCCVNHGLQGNSRWHHSGVRPQLMLMKLELLCCVNHGLQGNSRWHHSGVRPQLMLMKLELLCCVNHGLQGNSRWHHSAVQILFIRMLPSRLGFLSCVTHDRLVGLVVKASASRAEGPGFESR